MRLEEDEVDLGAEQADDDDRSADADAHAQRRDLDLKGGDGRRLGVNGRHTPLATVATGLGSECTITTLDLLHDFT